MPAPSPTDAPPIWTLHEGEGPLVAVAVHDGHAVREALESRFALSAAERLREEDPFTARWAPVAPTYLVGTRSRFEVDLNRPRDAAVYRVPDDAWGLDVWQTPPDDALVEASLAGYDAFYAALARVVRARIERHGHVVVYDLHSYNHRRDGPDAPPAPAADNPEVNVGTGTLPDRDRWAPVVERFMADLRAFDFDGRRLDVRENVRFQGGQIPRWLHETFPGRVCALAIEFKKFFMDEWTGEPDDAAIERIRRALASTVPGVLAALDTID